MFRHDLCLALGGMTVEEMGQRMSQREFMDWSVYAEINGELSPARRWDRGPALVAYMLQALQGGKGKLADYLPFHKPDALDIEGDKLEAALLAQFQV